MKLKEGEQVWVDDNTVDFSRKNRTHRNNRKVSSQYEKFNPEDMTLDGGDWECNPSVNKKTWPLSEEFDDSLNRKSHLLNKGMSRRVNIDDAFERGRDLGRLLDAFTIDDDGDIMEEK